MGDRAWVGITIYAVAEQDARAVWEWLEDQGLLGVSDDVIILGLQYTADEMSLGWCSEEVTGLIADAPSVVVDACQANRYEFDGEQLYYTPQTGTFLGDASGSGAVVINEMQVTQVFRKLPDDATATDMHSGLMGLFGVTHRNAVYKIAEPLRKRYDEDWDQWDARLPHITIPEEED